MFCENCGANIGENAVCPHCQASVKSSDAVKQMQEQAMDDNLLGKEYAFHSTGGMRFSIFGHRILNQVNVGDDRIYIKTSPKKCNKAPAVLYEDITGITIGNKIALEHILVAICAFIGGFASVFTFLLIPIILWLGWNKKIVISQRNGNNVVIYSRDKQVAQEFKDDMSMLCKIQ